jgi:hypothetical protein
MTNQQAIRCNAKQRRKNRGKKKRPVVGGSVVVGAGVSATVVAVVGRSVVLVGRSVVLVGKSVVLVSGSVVDICAKTPQERMVKSNTLIIELLLTNFFLIFYFLFYFLRLFNEK